MKNDIDMTLNCYIPMVNNTSLLCSQFSEVWNGTQMTPGKKMLYSIIGKSLNKHICYVYNSNLDYIQYYWQRLPKFQIFSLHLIDNFLIYPTCYTGPQLCEVDPVNKVSTAVLIVQVKPIKTRITLFINGQSI